MSRVFKKLISVTIAAAILLSALVIGAYAKEVQDYNEYPVVLVPGYASASLCFEENGKTSTAWGWAINDLSTAFAKNIVDLIKGFDLMLSGEIDYLGYALGQSFADLLEPMECNPDGTSIKKVKPVLSKAAETNDKYLNEKYPGGDYRVELDLTKDLDKRIGEESVFYFNCDFRMSALACADDLDRYITQVKEYTGKDKVNIVAVSHGGLITAAYLSLYKGKCDVFNVVMDEPALNGAELARDLMNGTISFDEETLVKYIEYHAQSETDYNWLVKAQQFDVLDDIVDLLLPFARESVRYWGSLWDFVPLDDYEALKEKYLDSEESALLIKQSDYVHYELMSNYKELFKQAKELGINVNIIAGTGNPIVSGSKVNSDGIIAVESSTGAACAPLGTRFSNGYKQKNDLGERMISPSMDIDASTSYLPYNTWFVEGLFHGMEYWDEYSRDLLFTLLLGDGSMNVHSNRSFPRFKSTSSVTSSVYAAFDVSDDGFLTSEDTCLKVTNLSQKYDMYILSINCEGMEIDFDWDFRKLAAGESKNVKFSGDLPLGITYTQITITYFLWGSVTPLAQRKQYFTVNNETGLQIDEGFVRVGFETRLEKQSSPTVLALLQKTGLIDFANLVYDAANSKWDKLVGFFKR